MKKRNYSGLFFWRRICNRGAINHRGLNSHAASFWLCAYIYHAYIHGIETIWRIMMKLILWLIIWKVEKQIPADLWCSIQNCVTYSGCILEIKIRLNLSLLMKSVAQVWVFFFYFFLEIVWECCFKHVYCRRENELLAVTGWWGMSGYVLCLYVPMLGASC